MTAAGEPMSRTDAAALLGVDVDADPGEVQHAYLRAARAVHPDLAPGADRDGRREADAAFDRVVRAREALLRTPPPAVQDPRGPSDGPVFRRVPGRGLGGSLVVLVLLAFLLVALVSLQQGFAGDGLDGPAPTAPALRPSPL